MTERSSGIHAASLPLPHDRIASLVARALPRRRVVQVEPLTGGLSNVSYRVRLDPALDVVLRIHTRDPAACRKEVALLELVAGTVPVPELLHAEPDGIDGVGPFALLRWVDGITLHALTQSGDHDAIAQAAASAGATLAAIGRHTFARGGWLEATAEGLVVGPPLLPGADAGPRFVDRCLSTPQLQRWMGAELRGRVHGLVWAWAPRLAALDDEHRLVHCDFRKLNVIVAPAPDASRAWGVAAVLDWEFAVAGAPITDVANFLRYERADAPTAEPHFSRAFVAAGGELPNDWRPLARVVDLIALCEMLSRDRMPEAIAAEIVGLVTATVRTVRAA